jgi:septal ring factor EnvC (AmiA/AmiB activator)
MQNPFDPWITHQRPSVYVISDSQLAAYKQEQTQSEIDELNKLIDSHKTSIERLEAHVADLKKDLEPAVEQPKAA